MKYITVNQKQYTNIRQLRDYFAALPKRRIKQNIGAVVNSGNPYEEECCVGTHMSICLNERKKSTNTFSHSIWRDEDFLKEHLGIKPKHLQNISKTFDPLGPDTWKRSPKKAFRKLFAYVSL